MSAVAKIDQPAKREEPYQKQPSHPEEAVQHKLEVDTVTKKDKIETPVIIPENSVQTPVFKVQLFVTLKNIKAKSTEFKGVGNTDYFVEDGMNKYTVGNETDYAKIEKIRRGIASKFPKAFIIAFQGDKKISAREALKLIK